MSTPPQAARFASPALYIRLKPVALLCTVTLTLLFALNFAPPSVSRIVDVVGVKFMFGLLGVTTAIGGLLLWLTMMSYTLKRDATLPVKASLVIFLLVLNIVSALCIFFTTYRSEAEGDGFG